MENGDEIYYHEDSFCQVEFCPAQNKEALIAENQKINNFAAEHFDGVGYTRMYVRDDEKSLKIKDLQIPFDKVDYLLKEMAMKRIDNVFEGYGSSKHPCTNTVAYTLHGAKIFVYPKTGSIKEFWVNDFRFHKDVSNKSELKQLLLAIGRELNVVLNDWDLCVMVDLTDPAQVEKYLDEALDV